MIRAQIVSFMSIIFQYLNYNIMQTSGNPPAITRIYIQLASSAHANQMNVLLLHAYVCFYLSSIYRSQCVHMHGARACTIMNDRACVRRLFGVADDECFI